MYASDVHSYIVVGQVFFWIDLFLTDMTKLKISLDPGVVLIGSFEKIEKPLSKYHKNCPGCGLKVNSVTPFSLSCWFTEMI